MQLNTRTLRKIVVIVDWRTKNCEEGEKLRLTKNRENVTNNALVLI